MNYIYLSLAIVTGFIAGCFFNPPQESKSCPDAKEECTLFETDYHKAVINCVNTTDWEDYDCLRYMNTGKTPPTPTPKPTPKSVLKYKPYYDSDGSEE